MKKTNTAALIPPDLERCQAEIPSGSFMSLGVPKPQRCTNAPSSVITEKRVNSQDGRRDSMSVCHACLIKAYQQLGRGYFTVKQITVKRGLR